MLPEAHTVLELIAANQAAGLPEYVGSEVVSAIVSIIITVISAILSAVLAPGPPPPPKPSSIDDINAPTADDGRPIPVVFGDVLVAGPNVVWYGQLSWTERKNQGIVVGYRYFMGMHLAVCAGPVDKVSKILVGDRVAWEGSETSTTTITITKGGLFGGDDGEGGVSGDVELRFGGPTQGASPYLSRTDVLNTDVAFRGVLSLVLKGNGSLPGHVPGEGFYVGTTRYIKPWAVRVLRKPGRVWNAGTGNWDLWYPETAMVGDEANPAHIVYEVLTNAEWGMGYGTSIIDDAKFRAAAATLHAEGTGLGFIWSQQTSVMEFLQMVMDHVNAVLRLDPVTGTFWLKLIRDDYVTANLPELNDSNILELESFQRTGWGETVNEVVVKYRGINNKPKSVAVQNLANIQIQGRVVSETKEYPGIRNDALAGKIAARDLRAKSAGLTAISIRCNRLASGLGPGDCFRFDWDALGIVEMVMRVGQVSGGTLTDGSISIVAVQDVFALGEEIFGPPDPEVWDPPDPVPDPSEFAGPPAPSGLAATQNYQQIGWTWFTNLTNPSDAKSELWVSQTNNRANAVMIFQDYAAAHVQAALGGAVWYGWVRNVDAYLNYSTWAPTSATDGVPNSANAQIPSSTILSGGLASVHDYAGADVSVEPDTETLILNTTIALSQPEGTKIGLLVVMEYVGSLHTNLVELLVHETVFDIYSRDGDISARFCHATRFMLMYVPESEAITVQINVKHSASGNVLYEAPRITVMEVYA